MTTIRRDLQIEADVDTREVGELIWGGERSGQHLVMATVNPLTGGKADISIGGAPEGGTGLSALAALGLAATRRVDLVMIGDSNQAFGGHGFNRYLDRVLARRFGTYATGQIWAGSPTNSQHAGNALVSSNMQADASAEPLAANYNVLGGPAKAGYVPAATSYNSNTGGQTVQTFENGPFLTQALRAYWAYGVSEAWASGTFRPGIRSSVSPFTTIVLGSTRSTTAAARKTGLRITTADIAADAERNFIIEARWQIPSTNLTGPLVAYYTRVEAPAQLSGASCHTLYATAGNSAWDIAIDLQNTHDDMLSMWFAETRRLQLSAGQNPVIVVYINTGLNDRNEAETPSRGPVRIFGSGDSAAAYIDNLVAIQDRIRRIWEINRWPVGELHWLIVPSHRVSDPDHAKLVGYRDAVRSTLARQAQTSLVDLGALMTAAEATAGAWYDEGGVEHLTTAGYEAVSQLIVNQIP